jgi:DNA-binding CsgD family transcriptional regulator
VTVIYERKKPPARPGHLTGTEARYLTEVARGGSNADVAARMVVTEQAVKSALARARHRLGATSTVHLLALAITAGDVDPDCADGTGARQ